MSHIVQVPPRRISQERIDREAEDFSKSFRLFVEAAWPIVEPGAQFMDGYHIGAIAEHLQACADGQIQRLLINIPPRHGKTTLVSILFNCWLWSFRPTERVLSSSYSLDLAREASTKTRRVVKTEWYQNRWPHVVLSEDLDTKSAFETTATGKRQITSVGGSTTGLGGNYLILDDPHNALHAESAPIREGTVRWVRESWSTRNNNADAVQIVVMQRLHALDVSGYYLSEGGWTHLSLEAEWEGSKKTTSIGWSDPRSEPGELLWPERFGTEKGRKELEALKKTLGSVGVAGQLQQRPVPRGGSTFRIEWLRFWYDPNDFKPDPISYPKPDGTSVEHVQRPLLAYDRASILHSWDLAFKGGEKNDFVVGQTWVKGLKDNKANHYLIDQIRGNFDFVQSVEAIRKLEARHDPGTTIVEEKANGAGAITSLKAEIPAMIAINPEGGKESRANGIAPLFEAGNIWLPHPKMPGYEWVQAYIDELLMFPRGANDDQVDATTQALIRLRKRQSVDIDMGPSMLANGRESPWSGA